MASKNDLGRENQQERLKTIGWIVGFVDGEGCFSVSVFKNKTTKNGWQIGCGNIFVNHRYDNHNENLYRYCVRNIHDLKDKIIPFFESNNLRSAKIKDLNIFKEVVLLMINKKHLQKEGFDKILSIAGKRKI